MDSHRASHPYWNRDLRREGTAAGLVGSVFQHDGQCFGLLYPVFHLGWRRHPAGQFLLRVYFRQLGVQVLGIALGHLLYRVHARDFEEIAENATDARDTVQVGPVGQLQDEVGRCIQLD